MKKIFLIAFIFIGTMSFAQSSKKDDKMPPPIDKMKNMSAENIATLKSKKMTLQLDLSKTQQSKVYDLILKSTLQMKAQRANRTEGKPSKEMRFEMQNKMLDAKIAYNKSIKSILNDEQYSFWKKQNLMKKKKPKH